MNGTASGRIVKQNDGRPRGSMTSVIGHDGPEEAGLGLSSTGIKHRRARLVHEHPIGALQMPSHAIDYGLEMKARAADPVAKGGADKVDTLTRIDVSLAIERKMIAELRHDDLGDQRLGGQTTRHDMLGCVCLHHCT